MLAVLTNGRSRKGKNIKRLIRETKENRFVVKDETVVDGSEFPTCQDGSAPVETGASVEAEGNKGEIWE